MNSIRVGLDLLDTLMTGVSELVLTRNELVQVARSSQDAGVKAALQRLNLIVSELQGNVMRTRMQPVDNAWSKLPRIVRDLARALDKKIEVRMTGAETELDRQVLEMIRDPLTHIVRNSCDHGLESPAERRAAGKDETGVISLDAFHEGGHIVMTISDDGRGLDLARVRRKALESGLATEAAITAMDDAQVTQFIFRSGFSTAGVVTEVSGRGVGMDVVRTNVERMGGTVSLTTAKGRGTQVTIKIPLTLAIISALVVECGGHRYAVPQIAVTEMVRAGGAGGHVIERINGTPVMRLRGQLLPLVSLRERLGLPTAANDSGRLVIVTRVGPEEFGIVVDEAHDAEEIVVKPLAPLLKDIPVFSGNTILGCGSVCMILDPSGVIGRDRGGQAPMAATAGAAQFGTGSTAEEVVPMFLVRAGEGVSKAVPLEFVARLEEIATADVSWNAGRMVAVYRGRLMPLALATPSVAFVPDGRKPILVISQGKRQMGIVVDAIEDIVEEPLDLSLRAGRPDLIGTALIGGKPVEVLDIRYFVEQAAPEWLIPPPVAELPAAAAAMEAPAGVGGAPEVEEGWGETSKAAASPDRSALLEEVRAMERLLQEARDELLAIGMTAIGRDGLADAPMLLDVVVAETERATTDIMERAEKTQAAAIRMAAQGADPEQLAEMDQAATAILLACSFQDLTGQRIRRAAAAMRILEEGIAKLLEMLGIDEEEIAEATPPPAGEVLLNGPALPGDGGLGQGAVDDLFG